MIASLDDLAPEARDVAEAYLAEATAGLADAVREGVLSDLRDYLADHLDAADDAAAVRRVIASTGPVEEPSTSETSSWWRRLVPWTADQPSVDSFLRTLWNPADRRVLVPNVVGLGWTVNFGGIAARLGLIEPDAEDVPFDSTPEEAFDLAALVPAGLAAAVVLHYVVRGPSLPSRLAAHWTLGGEPDSFIGKGAAAALDIGLTAGAAILASTGGRGRRRAGMVTLGTVGGVLGAALTLTRPLRRLGPGVVPAIAVGVLGTTGGVLYGLARAGRAAEIARDLPE